MHDPQNVVSISQETGEMRVTLRYSRCPYSKHTQYTDTHTPQYQELMPLATGLLDISGINSSTAHVKTHRTRNMRERPSAHEDACTTLSCIENIERSNYLRTRGGERQGIQKEIKASAMRKPTFRKREQSLKA